MVIRVAPWNIPLERRLQTFACLIVCLLPIALILANVMCILNPLLWLPYACYLGFIHIYDKKSQVTGERRWSFVRKWTLFRYFRDFFPAKLIIKGKLDENTPYLMAMHPHGIIGMSAWSCFLNEHEGSFASMCPNMEVRFVTLASNFKIPFFRELLLWVGLIDASASTIKYTLNRGSSVLIMVGGAEESLYARPNTAEIILNKRKGFVKIALQMGTPIVPVYCFGENELFYQVDNPRGSLLRKAQEYIKGITGVALPVIHGRGIFFYDYGFLPFRVPLVTVIGEPIPVPKLEAPADEEISKYHALYIENLKKLYNEYKGSDDLKIL